MTMYTLTNRDTAKTNHYRLNIMNIWRYTTNLIQMIAYHITKLIMQMTAQSNVGRAQIVINSDQYGLFEFGTLIICGDFRAVTITDARWWGLSLSEIIMIFCWDVYAHISKPWRCKDKLSLTIWHEIVMPSHTVCTNTKLNTEAAEENNICGATIIIDNGQWSNLH